MNMKRIGYIVILLVAVMMLPMGCANKKRIKMQQELERQQAIERQRIQDSIAQAEELARLLEEERIKEQQRVQDSILQAEEKARRNAVQTLVIPRMTVTVNMSGQQMSTPATLRWQRGTGALLSVQPFAGIEMIRIEQDPQGVTVIDKINRRYARLSDEEIQRMGVMASQADVDEWIQRNIIDKKDEPQLILQTEHAGISGSAVIYTNTMQFNAHVNIRATNVETYKKVTLEQLVRGL